MLKQLQLRAKRRELEMQRKGLAEKQADIETRTAAATAALDEAQTEADMAAIRAEIEALEGETREANLPDAVTDIDEQLRAIEEEMSDLDTREKQSKTPAPTAGSQERSNHMHRLQVREMLKSGAYFERAEVKEFYEKFRSLRAVTGGDLTIPEIVVNRIMDIMGDYTTLYPLVDHVRTNGTVRILLDTDTTPAAWIEQKGALPTGDAGTITSVDFDGFKVGKVTFVDNSMLADSIVNLDEYVTKKIARSIAMALDKGIAAGEGAAKKQPDGIIPKLPEANKVKVTAPTGFVDLVKPIALIDTGEDESGEIIAVMKRKTYYNRCVQYSVQPTSDGNVVAKLPNLSQPDLLGLRVVFNNYIPDDAILYGDFSKYTLVERESIAIDKSEHVKFSEDQTGFRGKGRFDGKPTKPAAFVLVTIADSAPTEEGA